MTTDNTRPDLARRRFTLVALWAPAVFVAVGVAIQLVLMPQVPATIAVHWNAAGEANGFAPAWTQPLATIAFGLGIPALIALMTLPGLRRGDRGPTYGLMGAVAAGTSALVTVAFTWTFAMQAGLATPVDAPTVWGSLIASFAAGILVGVAAWFAQPREESPSGAAAPAAAALPLGERERALWIRTATMTPGAALAIALAVLSVAAGAVVAWVTGADAAVAWLLTGVAVVLLGFAATTVAFHVRVDDSGLHVDSALGIPRLRVPLDDVASAARVDVNPMGEFGGWGLRLSTGRRFGVILRTGEALEVTRIDGKRFVVTVDDALTGAALLEALVARDPSRP
ncbi:DUF1648 domain-containing protein [Microbacterium allomyrinae]|uniref:DUF1648 domain-containing protein n=1 Tax=Microbacterium allomyrinae TaxID=2830666 RepID=A0A9X1LRL3_9MICO|nr:DUF1648 domain-containing protein [Microbacterium allomyrinae]MCC2030694.1 DUF1648 domain-containing protein [Microbacterium allomyrinae]